MSTRENDPRSFLSEAELEELSRALPDQIARLRAEIDVARARLSKTAREVAKERGDGEEPSA